MRKNQMSDETIDLFVQHAIQKAKEEDNFWKNVESEAARLEVTADYYLAEFV
jgi:hypothetical protein